jgi:hypothetical protein
MMPCDFGFSELFLDLRAMRWKKGVMKKQISRDGMKRKGNGKAEDAAEGFTGRPAEGRRRSGMRFVCAGTFEGFAVNSVSRMLGWRSFLHTRHQGK